MEQANAPVVNGEAPTAPAPTLQAASPPSDTLKPEVQTAKVDADEALKVQLKGKEHENELLKERVKILEVELAAALAKPGGRNNEAIECIKRQHEELLSKAKGLIFDKTKVVKNQELQLEALNAQVNSLKDVSSITKDMLEIRNTEVKHLEARLEVMDAKFKAEKERHELMTNKIELGTKMNEDLKKEYNTQLALFKELRVKYEERVEALMKENLKLTETLEKGLTQAEGQTTEETAKPAS